MSNITHHVAHYYQGVFYMLGVILTGHGHFATGLYDAVIQIMGRQPQFMAIDFPDGESSDVLADQLKDAVLKCDQGDGIIFLTDILGGSPFRTSAQISFEHENIEVITGTNLQLIIEMLLEREGLDVVTFRDMAIERAKSGVTSLWHETTKKNSNIKVQDDGI